MSISELKFAFQDATSAKCRNVQQYYYKVLADSELASVTVFATNRQFLCQVQIDVCQCLRERLEQAGDWDSDVRCFERLLIRA
jgi:hypothetical protein